MRRRGPSRPSPMPCRRNSPMRPDAVKSPRREGVLVLGAFLPYRLSVLSNTVSGRIAKSYAARFSLTVPEWRVMAVLGRFPGLTAGEVTERTAMDKVQVSRAVARLLKTKRIERRVVDDDRRVRPTFFTGLGRGGFHENGAPGLRQQHPPSASPPPRGRRGGLKRTTTLF